MSSHRQPAQVPDGRELVEREDALAGREHAVSEREEAARLREQLVAAREEALAAREEAERAKGELEKRVVELREANENLVVAAIREQTARELAARSSRIKDEFLPMLAHELRNPLAPILNAVDLLNIRETQDPQLIRIHALIKRQVRQMARLLDDLLDLSRITTGKMFLQKRPVAVAEFMEAAIETAQPQIDARGQSLTVVLPSDPLCVDGDPDRLTQVLSNLLNNASKYTPAGGAISISAEQRDARVAIRVADNGSGIAADVMPHIFELFAQEFRSLARSQGGLGIGLTVARDLTEMHGGTIEAHSEGAGKGSEFVVMLPLLASAQSEPIVESWPAPAAGGEARRIVVIEDNVDACEMLKSVLEMDGHRVSLAFGGMAGVRLVHEVRPDIVICDIGLPEMDGYAVIARLREQQETMPFMVALTGYGRAEDRMRALAAGFDRYLVKPVASQTLLDLISGQRGG